MTVNFCIIPERGLVVVRYSDFAAIDDTMAASKAYLAHPDYAAGQKQLVDFTNITGYEKDYVRFMNLQAAKAEQLGREGVLNFVPVTGHWGTLPQSVKGAPNGTTSTQLYRRL